MYGTRDAPAEWQNVVTRVMKELGFLPSSTTPCLYYYPERELRVIIHVDDFLCSGEAHHLSWLKAGLERKFTLKASVLGSQPGERKEVKFLNRLIRWTSEGLEVEWGSSPCANVTRGMGDDGVQACRDAGREEGSGNRRA